MDVLYLAIVVFSVLLIYYNIRSRKCPPGPLPIPLIGNTLTLKKLIKKHKGLPNALRTLCEKYNTNVLSITFGGNYSIFVQTEALVEEVYKSSLFLGRPDNFFLRLRCLGTRKGITMTDGPLWKEQRAFAIKHLHELGLGRRKMDYMIQKQCQNLLSNLENNNLSNLDMKKSITKCVVNVLWELITGSSFKDEESFFSLISLMEQRSKAFDMAGGLLTEFPWIRYLLPEYSGYNLINNINNKFKKLISDIINYHKETYEESQTRDFIDSFLHEMQKKSSSAFNEEQLIMVCFDFFIGGSQITSNVLDFCFLYMASNKDVQEKVQNELDNALLPGQTPSVNDREKCPYVEAVILEVQRKAAITPILGPKRALADTYLNGYFIPKGTTILLDMLSVFHSNKKWDNAEIFIPERFLNEEGKINNANKLLNFGTGKRSCVAENLAKATLFILFSGVLHNYKLNFADEKKQFIDTIPGITVSPAEYKIKLTKRFNSNNKEYAS